MVLTCLTSRCGLQEVLNRRYYLGNASNRSSIVNWSLIAVLQLQSV